jgi:membrane-bound lytic murein transglycosylase D
VRHAGPPPIQTSCLSSGRFRGLLSLLLLGVLFGFSACASHNGSGKSRTGGPAGTVDDSLGVERELKRLQSEVKLAREKGATIRELRRLFVDIESLDPDLAGRRQDQLSMAVAQLMVEELKEDPGLEMELEVGSGIHSVDFAIEQYGDSLSKDSLLVSMLPDSDDGEALDSVLVHDLDSLATPGIPYADEPAVDHMIEYFVNGKGNKHYKVWMERYPAVAAVILPILREEGVPEDLIFLSMIESGFKLHARSKARAVGAWQFIAETGRRSGLQVDKWVDERLDLELSTRAAARLLKSLYNNYGDWYLAFGAYNAGPGRIDRMLRTGNGNRNFFEMHRLPAETRNYVPTYLAAREVFRRRAELGFEVGEIPEPMETERVHVPNAVSMARAAELLGMSESELREMNLHILNSTTAPRGCELRVPPDKAEAFRVAVLELPREVAPPAVYADRVTHTVRKGDTLGKIARKYGVTTASLRTSNKLGRSGVIHPGQKLVIPGAHGGGSVDVTSEENEPAEVATSEGRRSRIVRKGDALSLIASRAGVSVEQLKRWNGLKNSRIYKGQKLWVSPPDKNGGADDTAPSRANRSVRNHIVQEGETAGKIAQKYSLSLDRLLEANGLNMHSVILPGQKLRLPDGALQAREEQREQAPEMRTHRVQKGETLDKIARKYSVSMKDLAAVNNLARPNSLKVGQVLKVPGPGESRSSTDTGSLLVHKVAKGDTLSGIAAKYNVSVNQLRQWNGLSSSQIQVGMRLKIRQGGQG